MSERGTARRLEPQEAEGASASRAGDVLAARPRSFRVPDARRDGLGGLLAGLAVAGGLFVLMAFAQMLGEVAPPDRSLEDSSFGYRAPELVKIEEEPPPEQEEPPPEELEQETPEISLDQLDIALNPGTGGSLAGDFRMPDLGSSAKDLGTSEFVDFSNLDQVPRPVGASGFHFPRHLRKRKVEGKIVLLLKLSPRGQVLDAQVEASSLPRFNDVVVRQVKSWRFTPPTRQGEPVRAMARLPIPIRIN